MSERAFPFPLVGTVHVNNAITVHRPVDRRRRAVASASGPRTCARIPPGGSSTSSPRRPATRRAGWSSRSTYLRRGGGAVGGEGTASGGRRPGRRHRRPAGARATSVGATARCPATAIPIHLHALTAKAFGFPSAIAHGMWLKARTLATLEGRLPERVHRRRRVQDAGAAAGGDRGDLDAGRRRLGPRRTQPEVRQAAPDRNRPRARLTADATLRGVATGPCQATESPPTRPTRRRRCCASPDACRSASPPPCCSVVWPPRCPPRRRPPPRPTAAVAKIRCSTPNPPSWFYRGCRRRPAADANIPDAGATTSTWPASSASKARSRCTRPTAATTAWARCRRPTSPTTTSASTTTGTAPPATHRVLPTAGGAAVLPGPLRLTGRRLAARDRLQLVVSRLRR